MSRIDIEALAQELRKTFISPVEVKYLETYISRFGRSTRYFVKFKVYPQKGTALNSYIRWLAEDSQPVFKATFEFVERQGTKTVIGSGAYANPYGTRVSCTYFDRYGRSLGVYAKEKICNGFFAIPEFFLNK